VTLLDNVLHAGGSNDEATDATAAIGYTITDADGSAVTGNTLTITFDDDAPSAFVPSVTNVVNTGTADTLLTPVSLGLAGNLGADGLGSVVFLDDFAGDNLLRTTTGTLVTSGGQNIVLSGYGTGVLSGTTTGGLHVFTVTLNGAGDNYTVDFDRMLDDGSGVSLSSLGFATAGNKAFNYIDVAGTTEDLLFSGYNRSGSGAISIGTVNTNNVAIGVNNQSMNDGDALRIDFVNSPTVSGSANNTYDYPASPGHYGANNFSFTIVQVGGSTPADAIEIWVRAYDADDVDPSGSDTAVHFNELADDPQLAITAIQVNGVNLNLALLTSDGNGGYLITGLDLNDRVTVTRTGGYDRLEIENATSGTSGSPLLGESFDIGEFAFTKVTAGIPLHLAFDLRLTDGDGDTVVVADAIQINTTPAPVVLDLDGDGVEFLATSAGVTFDYAGDGNLVNTAWASGDDGLLAIDLNGDGAVNNGSEIVFGGNGLSDLQGLAASYDTNGDGQLTAADSSFAKFGVWQDADSDGITDQGEFRSLEALGIVSIKLTSDGLGYTAANGDVTVVGTSSFTRADGSIGAVADAMFATQATSRMTARTMEISTATALLAGALATTATEVRSSQEDSSPLAVRADQVGEGDASQDALVHRPAMEAASAREAIDLLTGSPSLKPLTPDPTGEPHQAADAGRSVAASEQMVAHGATEVAQSHDSGAPNTSAFSFGDAGSTDSSMDALLALGAAPSLQQQQGIADLGPLQAVLTDAMQDGFVDKLVGQLAALDSVSTPSVAEGSSSGLLAALNGEVGGSGDATFMFNPMSIADDAHAHALAHAAAV